MTEPARRIVVAINPAASFGARSHLGPRVVADLVARGHTVVVCSEASAAELESATRSALAIGAEDQADALVVVGGDGMVSLAVNMIAETGIALGIIPAGTGNDFARGLGIPLGDVDAALAVIDAGLGREPSTVDLGIALHASGRTWFAGAVSAGLDAKVNHRANRMSWPKGSSRYLLAMVIELLRLRPLEYSVTIDGRDESLSAVLLAVANNRFIGGGMNVAPAARVDDGRLDFFAVLPVGRLRFLRVFPRVFSGTHTTIDVVDLRSVSRVRIDGPDVVAYADGERIGRLPIDVEIRPGALRIVAHPSAPSAESSITAVKPTI